MNVSTRKEVIRLWYGGASRRQIARRLSISRRSVVRVLADHENRPAEVDYGERRRAYLPDRPRFETASAVEVYMDDFRTAGGLRRVCVFSYVLTCSRLVHVRFVAAEGLATTLQIASEEPPATCRYDNMRVLVKRNPASGS
jgi:transposase